MQAIPVSLHKIPVGLHSIPVRPKSTLVAKRYIMLLAVSFILEQEDASILKPRFFKLTPFLLINRFLTQKSHACHTIQYCTNAHSRCEIYDHVMVLIWNFACDMFGHELNILLIERY